MMSLFVLGLLLVLIMLYALTDRIAPNSSRGIVSAHVVQIAPRVSGEVIQVLIDDDAFVQAGTPLFTIDPYPFQLAVRQAEANFKSTLQSVDASGAAIVAAQAGVTQARVARDNARTEAERTLRLAERGLVSQAQADSAKASVDDANARLVSAEANLDSAKVELGSLGRDNPAIEAAAVQLERAQYDLTSATVTAPHKGVVTNVLLSAGQFINAGAPSLTFIDAEAAWVTVDLRENQLQLVNPGDAVHLLFDAVPGKIFVGRVQSIAWGIDSGRSMQGGLVVNQHTNRWFEPARHIPVRIELEGGMAAWPKGVRVGGKVHTVVFAGGKDNPISWLANGLQRARSITSFLH
ncbi:multidrug transporter [Rheinheimera salexigens]|uniref:Multidrug transporter n=2 Tax=Rheinheimera salexigens TaxID=1628148 RepID=A0A1E7QAH1_9GAMM|nr:multidrug transporter [Rheinheimera salexigens]